MSNIVSCTLLFVVCFCLFFSLDIAIGLWEENTKFKQNAHRSNTALIHILPVREDLGKIYLPPLFLLLFSLFSLIYKNLQFFFTKS